MSKLIIYSGTTEGLQLFQFCLNHHIQADISVATKYGATYYPPTTKVYSERMDATQIYDLLLTEHYQIVIDATHPYATEITENLKKACKKAKVHYYRILRESKEIEGDSVDSIEELIALLNKNNDIILSTLGSKSIHKMQRIINYKERLWLRILPSQSIMQEAISLGFQKKQIIQAKGPFSIEQNIKHIQMSHASILVTKESGAIGGYPEKLLAAKDTGCRVITLSRPKDEGISYDELTELLLSKIQLGVL